MLQNPHHLPTFHRPLPSQVYLHQRTFCRPQQTKDLFVFRPSPVHTGDKALCYEPKSVNVAYILPYNSTCITGAHPVMNHTVLAFPLPPNEDVPKAILNLASLQFGDAGRGFNGRQMAGGYLCSRVLINIV